MWLNITEEQYKTFKDMADEATRNADSDAHNGVRGAAASGKKYTALYNAVRRQAKDQNPFRLIRAICEENDWEEGNSPGNRIWSVADGQLLLDPDTEEEP